MRTHRLGIFEGLTEMIAVPYGDAPTSPTTDQPGGGNGEIKPRLALLARRVSDLGALDAHEVGATGKSPKFARLPDRWVEERVLHVPRRHTWAHLHAVEVWRKRSETNWSQQKLAAHFEVSPPTIRHALQLAREMDEVS